MCGRETPYEADRTLAPLLLGTPFDNKTNGTRKFMILIQQRRDMIDDSLNFSDAGEFMPLRCRFGRFSFCQTPDQRRQIARQNV